MPISKEVCPCYEAIPQVLFLGFKIPFTYDCYANVINSAGFYNYKKHIFRMPIPETCPEKFAKLITDCWEQEASLRPDFKVILHRLNEMLCNGKTNTGDIPR